MQLKLWNIEKRADVAPFDHHYSAAMRKRNDVTESGLCVIYASMNLWTTSVQHIFFHPDVTVASTNNFLRYSRAMLVVILSDSSMTASH